MTLIQPVTERPHRFTLHRNAQEKAGAKKEFDSLRVSTQCQRLCAQGMDRTERMIAVRETGVQRQEIPDQLSLPRPRQMNRLHVALCIKKLDFGSIRIVLGAPCAQGIENLCFHGFARWLSRNRHRRLCFDRCFGPFPRRDSDVPATWATCMPSASIPTQ